MFSLMFTWTSDILWHLCPIYFLWCTWISLYFVCLHISICIDIETNSMCIYIYIWTYFTHTIMCIYICIKMCIYNIHDFLNYYYYYWNHYLPLQRSVSVQNRKIYCSCLFNSWENSQFLLTNIQIFYQFDPLSDACWNLLLLYKFVYSTS